MPFTPKCVYAVALNSYFSRATDRGGWGNSPVSLGRPENPRGTPMKAFARRGDPQTSLDAANRVNDHVSVLEAMVYEAVWRSKCGLNWNEVAHATGKDKASISPRFKPLRKKGLIRAALDEDGEVVRRDHQTVWVANR